MGCKMLWSVEEILIQGRGVKFFQNVEIPVGDTNFSEILWKFQGKLSKLCMSSTGGAENKCDHESPLLAAG